MPIIKTVRAERVVYSPEWIDTLEKAKKIVGLWFAAWLAFDWIFGKRRNEISKVYRKDVWIEHGYLYTRFYVGKKRSKTASVDQLPYTKRKVLQHKGIPYILEYLKEYDESIKASSGYLFPWSNPRKQTVTVRTKFKNREGNEETREYTYPVQIGYINPSLVNYYLKKVNDKMWLHLGRHSVATRASEDGATEYDIANILDVSPRTASKYVHHGTKLTEEWSKQVD
jgi:hypothetical protein